MAPAAVPGQARACGATGSPGNAEASGDAEAPADAPGEGGEPAGRGVEALAVVVERLRRDIALAQRSADAKVMIALAAGILVERGHGGPSEAARHLERLAEAARLPLLELAADIVNAAARDAVAEACPVTPPAGSGRRVPPSVLRLRSAEASALGSDPQTATESLLAQALAPLGAGALALWAAGADGSVTLAGHAGFPPGEAERWRYVPPGVRTLAQRALTSRQHHWYDSPPADALSIGHSPGAAGGSRSVLPARVAGRVLGVLEVCWPCPRPPLPAAAQRQMAALADIAAHTLSEPRAAASGAAVEQSGGPGSMAGLAEGLLDAALVLQPVLDDGGEVADFRIAHANEHFSDPAGRDRTALIGMRLLEAYPLSAEDGGLYERAVRVHSTGEPFRAERMVVGALIEGEPTRALAAVGIGRHGDAVLLTWRVEDEARRLAALSPHAQRLARIGGFEENLVTGEILWNAELFALHGLEPTAAPLPLERLGQRAHPDDSVAVGRFLRAVLHHRQPASTVFRLRRPDGIVRHMRVVAEPVTGPGGTLVALRGAYQDVSAQHWTEVALAATRDRLADSEELAAERDRLALELQRAIMPHAPAPFDASGLRVAVRYRPAEKDHLVGGDWYDAVVLPSKRVLLAVGDVAGHGIEAAKGMVVLRNALRGLAVTGAGPARLLGWLNAVAHHLAEQVTATAVCGIYDPRTRVLRWARAGHPPPALVRDGVATALPLPPGILLGALAEAHYEERELPLRDGDRLLMYTDGLIERRDRSVERSLEQLLTAVGTPALDLDEHLDRLLTHSRSDTDDDTCLIGIQPG
ncbi:SpoIIE family protein phosphatase [Streptomyces sp. URMC 123]|uniref:SpoIIE family protein phosphatase n=1 Tax=Streptomyces sp. URMC 123 TaxID=3423403 RepID=UPI003F1DDE20